MSNLIPNINWVDFLKIVQAGKIGELKSCEIKVNDTFSFTAIIPKGDWVAKDYIRTQAEYLGMKSNISEGKDPVELLTSLEPEDKYPYLTKARLVRKEKREKALAVSV